MASSSGSAEFDTGGELAPHEFRLFVKPGSDEDFGRWRWAVAPMFELDAPSKRDRENFGMGSVGFSLGGLAFGETQSSASVFTRTSPVIAKSGLDGVMFQVYLTGGYAFQADGVEGEARAGDIAVFDLSRPFVIKAVDYTNLSFVLQRRVVAGLISQTEPLHGLVLPQGSPLNAVLLSYLRVLRDEARRFSAEDAEIAVSSLAGLLAKTFGPMAHAREIAARGAAFAALQRVQAEIRARLDDPALDADHLCARCGVSRATLYRLFEPYGGVAAYIREARLARAYRTLTQRQGAQRISEIARRCGFADAAMFSRAFRQAYDVTPRDLRDAARAGVTALFRTPPRSDFGFGTLNRWLLGAEGVALG